MKRIVSTLVLSAFVLAGAAPCQAAIASCGMNMPSPDDLCGSCVTDTGSAPVLKAVSCCRGEPGQDHATAPAILSTSVAGSSAPVKAALAASSLPVEVSSGVTGSPVPELPDATGPPPPLVRTTVLRL